MKTRKGDYNDDGTPTVKTVPVEAEVSETVGGDDGVAVGGFDEGLADLLSLKMADLLVIADDEGADVPRKATKADVIAAIEVGRDSL